MGFFMLKYGTAWYFCFSPHARSHKKKRKQQQRCAYLIARLLMSSLAPMWEIEGGRCICKTLGLPVRFFNYFHFQTPTPTNVGCVVASSGIRSRISRLRWRRRCFTRPTLRRRRWRRRFGKRMPVLKWGGGERGSPLK